jgi:hypothetical protein
MTDENTRKPTDTRGEWAPGANENPVRPGDLAGCLGDLAVAARSAAGLAARAAIIGPPYLLGHAACHARYFLRLVTGTAPVEPAHRPWWCPPDLWPGCWHNRHAGLPDKHASARDRRSSGVSGV